jgi:hypothetical protein
MKSAILAWALVLSGQEGEAAKKHVEAVSKSTHAYVVRQGGTMDGRSCRSPVGTYEGWTQTWESNRSLRMENLGDADVVNPWLSNGRSGARNVQELIASALKPGMTDREKAMALYDLEIRHRYHWGGDNNELGDPIKVFNVYGYNTCGNDSICLAGLWNRAGLKASPARVVGHCVSQVFYDGRWHLYDGDMQGVYLMSDGRTVAGEQDIVRDHDLIKRTHTQGILRRADRRGDEWEAALYKYEGEERGSRDSAAKHTMDMVLRPGEALVWKWARQGPPKVLGAEGIKFAHTVCNGLWEYRPDFSRELWRKGAERAENARSSANGLEAEPGKAGSVQWLLKSPYLLVGGRIEADAGDFEASRDGKTWQKAAGGLDELLRAPGPAPYEVRVRCTLAAGKPLRKLAFLLDLQMAPLAMPEMAVGENRFTYTDASPGPRNVRITHEWVERSSTRPPAAPSAAVHPPNGGSSAGTRITFAWSPAKDPDGDRIADYQFQLSDREDLLYPVSPNFSRLVTLVSGRCEEKLALPRAGLLAAGGKYWWRVRAKDEKGVWGPWSPTWSFTAGGPAAPVDVRMDFDAARGTGTLRWKPRPEGSRPVKYRIHGSDEKGFTASDEPLPVFAGNGKAGLPAVFPPSFLAETPDLELTVVGPGVSHPCANRAWYRVVAVDAAGEHSGPSDAAASPRPFLSSRPETAAKVGRPYRYAATSIRSIGDLRARDGGKLDMNFWDLETPKYSLDEGPAWLRIDPATGILTGTPDKAGKARVVVSAVIEVDDAKIDERSLIWGHDKILSNGTRSLGRAAQEFVLDVSE